MYIPRLFLLQFPHFIKWPFQHCICSGQQDWRCSESSYSLILPSHKICHHGVEPVLCIHISIQCSSTLATSCEELTHWKRVWCWEGLGAGGEGDNRRWDGWMPSPTWCTWVWMNSRSWWWTGRPGMLQFMGSQRVGHDWVIELNWTQCSPFPWWPLSQSWNVATSF